MGSYEEFCFTIRPDTRSVEHVEEILHGITELSDDEIEPPAHIADDDWRDSPTYDFDRLVVDTTEEHACIGGRTYTSVNGEVWQWLLFERLDCGGLISRLRLAEVDATAFGRVFEWDGEEYAEITASLGDQYRSPLTEHSLASGAVVADKIARETGMRPARKRDLNVFWYGDPDFVSVQYLREGGKDRYHDDSGRRCWWFECDLSHRTDVQPVR